MVKGYCKVQGYCKVTEVTAKYKEKGRLINSIAIVLSTLTANLQSESHTDVASTDLCRWPSHSEVDGPTVVFIFIIYLYYTLYMARRQCKGIGWEGCVM